MDQNNHSGGSESSLTDWTSIDIKQFELILGREGDVEDHEFWEEMWRVVPGLSPAELNFLRKELAHDFEKIETGQFQLPIYADDLVSSGSNPSNSQGNATAVGKKKKGIPWSEEEKALFVKGLEKYGKGHWKEISKNFVTSRTPTQVASYAQKFFLAEKKRLKRLGISDLPPHRHQESSPASHFPIPSTFQIPPQQQQGFDATDYLLGNNLFYREQNLQNFISQFDLQAQALPPSQFNQRVHHGALVPDPAYRLEHQSHQTDCMNQRQHLMHSRNSTQSQFYQQHQSHQTDCMNQRQHLMHSRNSTQLQFYQHTHAEPLLRAQQTLDELQSRTRLVNFQIVDPWYVTSSNPTPRSGSDSFPSPTAQQAPAPNSRTDQNHKNTDKPY